MSEKLNKFRRKYTHFMEEKGIKNAPKRVPVLGHSNALCETGRHDFAKPVRTSKKRHVKENIRSKVVWDKSPRVKTCRQCATIQVQAKTGQWINAGKSKAAQLGI